MGDISKHFSRYEFSCNCGCGFNTVDTKLLEYLEQIRGFFGEPVIITSGCRCSEYNEKIGGSKNSQHTKGRAADIIVKNFTSKQVYDYAQSFVNGIGSYDDFTHIDSRDGFASW